MRKKPSLFLLLFTLLPFVLTSQDVIVVGREDNWAGFSLKNILLKRGWEGHLDLNVMGSVYRPDGNTDLLLSFDEDSLTDETGHYTLAEPAVLTEYEYRRGKSAAVIKEGSPVNIQPGRSSLFSGRAEWTDFSLEFHLYPALLREGEVVFHWKGLYRLADELIPQEISCQVSRRRLVWTFRNVFASHDTRLTTFTLTGDALVPRHWNHHLVRFDSETGLLEYLIDGIPAALTYTTPSGREESRIYQPLMNQAEPTPLTLGPEFTGFIDEVRLSGTHVDDPLLDDYEDRGEFLSPLIDLAYQHSLLESIEAVDRIPGDSSLYYYYAFSDRKEEMEKLRRDFSRPGFSFGGEEWHSFESGRELEETRGRYLLIGALLYPDLGASQTPTVSEIRINYQPELPPVPPLNIAVSSENGEVTVSWDYWKTEGMGGFQIYYGDRPGHYFGSRSPILAGPEERHYTMFGLEPKKRWYFSVVAFSDSDPAQYSSFSREVSVRP